MEKKKYNIVAEVIVPSYRSELHNITIKAESYERAKEVCVLEFENKDYSVSKIYKKQSPVLAIVFLAITFILGCLKYRDGFSTRYIGVDMVSFLLSILFYASFVIKIKGLENSFKDGPDWAVSLLFIGVFAIFIKICIGLELEPGNIIEDAISKIGKFFEKIPILNLFTDRKGLVLAGLVLSWVGIKQVSGFVWIAMFILTFSDICTLGDYMGNAVGIVFIISAFLGILFYIKYEGRVVLNSFEKVSNLTATYLKSNIDESRKLAQTGVNTISEKIQSRKNKEKGIEETEKKLEDNNEE